MKHTQSAIFGFNRFNQACEGLLHISVGDKSLQTPSKYHTSKQVKPCASNATTRASKGYV